MVNLDFLTCSITSDEDSPYLQCEIELKDSKDYIKFVRDTPFIVYLFDLEYHFIVDSRKLSRDIDEEGNYIETCSITGLSPLAQKANPRSGKIKKIWETPLLASTIVEELIGPVTWNLVDWVIPAYRLAADNAAPLDVATQIVTAVGGLIESLPDGAVHCRHRWPVSLNNFTNTPADHILTEKMIFSLTETPTNDELINRFRILDYDSGYQDKLEYVPNKIGENATDPFNGVLYVFPSPWRENLRIVTTRPSVITLGRSTNGVRRIEDANTDYPAEIVTFSEQESSVQYPIMELLSFEWLDEDLSNIVINPYSTTIFAGKGNYNGYSLAKISYTARYFSIPVQCSEQDIEIEAQFLLLENIND